jgi:hypothetical protein
VIENNPESAVDREPRPPDMLDGPLKANDKIKNPINGPPIIHIGISVSLMECSSFNTE